MPGTRVLEPGYEGIRAGLRGYYVRGPEGPRVREYAGTRVRGVRGYEGTRVREYAGTRGTRVRGYAGTRGTRVRGYSVRGTIAPTITLF